MVTNYERHVDRHVPDHELSQKSILYPGRYLIRTATTSAQYRADALFEQSISQNPLSGAGYAALASALCNRAALVSTDFERATVHDKARRMANTALARVGARLGPGLVHAGALLRCL